MSSLDNQKPLYEVPQGGYSRHRVLPSVVWWAIAIQHLSNRTSVIIVPLSTAFTGERVFASIKQQYHSALYFERQDRWLVRYFTRDAVAVAKVHWAVAERADSRLCFRASLVDNKHDTLLTDAFHHPEILAQEHAYASRHRRFEMVPTGQAGSRELLGQKFNGQELHGQEVLVIQRVIYKERIAWFLVCLLVVSPVCGYLIGAISQQVEVGVGVSVGIFALASFLQGLAAWIHG